MTKLTGETNDVLSRANELSAEGWDVYFFAVNMEPGADSFIVMGDPIDPDGEPYQMNWVE